MASSLAPKVCIIVVNWNGWRDTVECVRSLQKMQYSNYSIIVVDNASSDQSVEEINHRFSDITILESEHNRGFAGGNNLAITYAMQQGVDYVWLLNNDTTVEEHALTAMVDRMQDDPDLGICGSKLIFYDKRNTLQALAGGTYNKWLGITQNIAYQQPADAAFNQQKIEEKLEYIVGASMLVTSDFIKKIGLMTEDYFLYYEEIDWAMRGKNSFKLGFAPQSIVYHKEGASTGGRQGRESTASKNADYYQLKNRLKFTSRFFPLYLPSVYLTLIYAIFNRLRRGKWKRVPMILKIMFNFKK